MGKAPAVIIIVRHGARLDAEDKTWHLNSSTPYDSPLSYGGWTQTRALGARIGSLLHARDVTISQTDWRPKRKSPETASSSEEQGPLPPPPADALRPLRRRHKVIFHSSPFLRCVQSSLAISAGMAQYEGNLARFEAQHFNTSQEPLRTPARSMTMDDKTLSKHYTRDNQGSQLHTSSGPLRPLLGSAFIKPTLRIDAFLGEWLSADYFESITPPPSSATMVSGAKADLLKPATPILGSSQSPLFENSALEWNGHGFSEARSNFTLSELNDTLPNDSASSTDKAATVTQNGLEPSKIKKEYLGKNRSLGYVPPNPEYAISTSESIPRGYVADAREACTNVDFQWDSMWPPQSWGDGGEYTEEWSSMHRRFRKGLMDMITWYKENDPDQSIPKQAESSVHETSNDAIEEDDGEEDVVLIIVTHGAGCNALIGALTNQPVLLDIGMASLTMAVHKGKAEVAARSQRRRSSVESTRKRSSSVDTTQAEEYEVKLIASTEHLRAGAHPLDIPQLQSPTMMPSIPEGSDSASSGTSTPRGPSGERPAIAKNSSLGSIRRPRAASIMGQALGGGLLSASPTTTSPSIGLWGSGVDSNGSVGRRNSIHHRGQFQHKSLTFDIPGTKQSSNNSLDTSNGHANDLNTQNSSAKTAIPFAGPSPPRSMTQAGLWTGGLGVGKSPRRRWTFAENS